MSMVLCQGCRDLIDSDDDPECFTRHGNGPILCEPCREPAEIERELDYRANEADHSLKDNL